MPEPLSRTVTSSGNPVRSPDALALTRMPERNAVVSTISPPFSGNASAVAHQIQEHLHELIEIARHRRQRRIEGFGEGDIAARSSWRPLAHAGRGLRWMLTALRGIAGVAEGFHAVDERGDAVALLADELREPALAFRHAVFEQLRRAADTGERVLDPRQHRRHPVHRAHGAAVMELTVESLGEAALVQCDQHGALGIGDGRCGDVRDALAMARHREVHIALAD